MQKGKKLPLSADTLAEAASSQAQSDSFEEEMEKLKQSLIKMAVMTEIAIEEVIRALEQKDIALAHKIVSGDVHIDHLQRVIEQACVELIISRTPEEKNIRQITSILKMTTDIERIADHASDISEIVLKIAGDEEYVWDIAPIRRMSEFTRQMVKESIRAYIDKDILLAKNVCACDDQVDRLFTQAVEELEQLMAGDISAIPQATEFIFIAKYMERVGDHAQNLAEWVIYDITGEFR